MSQRELRIGVARHLDGHGIARMLTGSIASSRYGEPRLTHDVDAIVSITVESAAGIARAFPPAPSSTIVRASGESSTPTPCST
jgi:hypothetical protein